MEVGSVEGQKSFCSLFELKEFPYYKCVLAILLQNRAQYLKIFILKVSSAFSLFTMKISCTFFRNQFFQNIVFFAFWRKKMLRRLVKRSSRKWLK